MTPPPITSIQDGTPPGKTVLIICRKPSRLAALRRFRPRRGERYIVASDDMAVHHAAAQFPWIQEVCWIERMESCYQVADEVIRIWKALNGWLETLAEGAGGSPGLLHWTLFTEGGDTTRRLQDTLLLIRSYLFLFVSYQVDEVRLRHDPENWEDLVLMETARSRSIPIRRMRFLRTWAEALLKRMRRPSPARSSASEKVSLPLQPPEGIDGEIVFQLCSPEEKHVENIIPVMEALHRKGARPSALTWRAKEGAEKVRRQGLPARELEDFLPPGAEEEGLRLEQILLTASEKSFKILSRNPQLRYEDVPLAEILRPVIRRFIKAETAERYLLGRAAGEYFRRNRPAAFKIWGGLSLIEGAVVLASINPSCRPMVFEYWVGMACEGPYYPEHPADLYLLVGDIQEELMIRNGVAPGKIAKVGQGRYDHLEEWSRKHDAASSRAILNIPEGYDFHIFYDPSLVLRGYLSSQEYALMTHALLRFVKKHPRVALILKPHPGHYPGALEEIISVYSLPNLFQVGKDLLPYHALNAADVIVTKLSTIGIEAMRLGRPVVCAVLDGEERWRFMFQEGAFFADRMSILETLLENLAGDPVFRAEWTEERRRSQTAFLRKYFTEPTEPCAVAAATAILSRLPST